MANEFVPLVRIRGEVTSALSNVVSSATNVTLQAANENRRMWSVFNDSDKDLYLKWGATATSTSYTVKVPPGAYYEMTLPVYNGVIDAIWAAGPTGSARVTELS